MKGKLHKSINYGWMVECYHHEIDTTMFYPLHPYDVFTCGVERVEGKEVDFLLDNFWNMEEEKMIKVAIINANIGQVEMTQVKQDLVFNENTGEVRFTSIGVNGNNSYKQPTPIEWLKQVYKVTGTLTESDFNYANNWLEQQLREAVKLSQTRKYNSHFHNADEITQSLKQPK